MKVSKGFLDATSSAEVWAVRNELGNCLLGVKFFLVLGSHK